MATRKISVSIEEDLVDAVQGRVGSRGVSRFVSEAVRHELERGELADLAPTALHLLGIEAPAQMTGKPLVNPP